MLAFGGGGGSGGCRSAGFPVEWIAFEWRFKHFSQTGNVDVFNRLVLVLIVTGACVSSAVLKL